MTNFRFNALPSVRNPYAFFVNHRSGLHHVFLVSVIMRVTGVGMGPLSMPSQNYAQKNMAKSIASTPDPLLDTSKQNHAPIKTKVPSAKRPQPAKPKPTSTSPPTPYHCSQMELYTTPIPYCPTQHWLAPIPNAAARGSAWPVM